MIVRELLTKIGYKVDKGGEQRAEKSFQRLKGLASELGLVLGAGAVVLGFKRMVDAASDVEETLNVVSTAFGNNAQSVLDWAKTHAEAAGRSEYQLRSYAAALGQVVAPTLQNDKATAELSTSLAALTVDMASFNNETEADTLGALRSGLIGSYEPLQRFGVVMNVATLETFAAARGIRKKMKDMTEAEKVQLRYNFILSRTAKQQGDAIRTAGGYANMTKRLEGTLLDLQVNLGKLFLPAMTAVVEALASATKAVGEFVYENKVPLMTVVNAVGNALNWAKLILVGFYEATALTKVGMLGLSVALALALGVSKKLLIVKTLLLAKFILIAAVIAGVIVILDDLWKAFTTGEGVLAGFLKEFTAVANETDSYSTAIRQSLQNALDFWIEYFFGVQHGSYRMGEAIRGFFRGVVDWLYDIIGAPGDWIGQLSSWMNVALAEAMASVIAWFGTLGDYIAQFAQGFVAAIETAIDYWIDYYAAGFRDMIAMFRELGADIMAILGNAWDVVSGFIEARIDYWRGLFGELASGIAETFEGISATIQRAIDSIVDWFADKLQPIIDQIKTAVDFWGDTFGGVTKLVAEVATDIGDAVGITPAAAPGPGAPAFAGAEAAGPAGPMAAPVAAAPTIIGPQVIAPPPAAARAGNNVNANQQIEVNVNAPGGDGPGIARVVAPAVGRAADDSNRRVAQQLLLGGVTP